VFSLTEGLFLPTMNDKDVKKKQEDIEKLVVEVQKGSHTAFSLLYDVFIDQVYRYVFYRVKSGEAEDLVETVFIKIWENINKYKHGKSNFSAWVFRIAHNVVVDHYRMFKDHEYDELDVNAPDYKREHNPIRTTEGALQQEVLKKALFKLKKQYQEVIIHKFINELSNEEISKILKKSEGSLRILQFRALKALKHILDEMGVNYHF
jgi:RNA polymerase sigma-70 factor, ECF subfamily